MKNFSVLLISSSILFALNAYTSYFPQDDNWEFSSPEDQGVNSEKVNKLIDLSFSDNATSAVVVIKNGKIIGERYADGYNSNSHGTSFDSFINTSTKEGIKNLLYRDEFLALGEVYRRHAFKYPVVMCGADSSRPNDICLFDLSFDPEEICELDFTEINKLIQAGGRDSPLKKYKINKTIPICSNELLTKNNHFDIEHSKLQRRAEMVKTNEDFQSKVSQAMQDRIMNFPEPDYVEGTIYSGGFPSYKDKDLMQEFHLSDNVEHLVKISRNFEDERFRILAERIICSKYKTDIPQDIMKRFDDLMHERIKTEGKWGSVEKSLQEIEKLLDENSNKEDKEILLATKEHLSSMIL